MNAKFAWRSSFGHLAYESKSAFVPVIISMYFISIFAPFWPVPRNSPRPGLS